MTADFVTILTTRIPGNPFLPGVFYIQLQSYGETVVACKLDEATLAHPWKSAFNLLKEGLSSQKKENEWY